MTVIEAIKSWFSHLAELVKNLIEFLTYDIWRLDFSKPQRFSEKVVRRIQVATLTASRFFTGRIGRESVFLSYYSAISLVPLVAVVIFISWSFGLDKQLLAMAQPYITENQHIAEMVLGWANNIVVQTRSGLFGVISFLAFIWIVIWLMISIEDTFNHIWNVKRSRNFFKSLGVYLLILILIPFFLLFTLYGAGYYTSVISEISEFGRYGIIKFFASNLYWVIFYGAAVFIFALMYKYVPHVKVRFRDCVKAAVWSALAFILLQYLYLEAQMGVTRLSGVYGAFAAIPLLMIWLNYSWQIILFGVYMTYAFEHVDDFDPDNDELWGRHRARRQQRRDAVRKKTEARREAYKKRKLQKK
ncbi:MAG: YihY/virulence factor BrkB family protein [Bacteroidales bacterium]|nr:YihY/virulence factor BrkB family protein [Bacteroidales bacterium]